MHSISVIIHNQCELWRALYSLAIERMADDMMKSLLYQ